MLHIGVYIYSLSKIYMYKNAYSVIGDKNLVYTDTDSFKLVND